MGYCCQGGEDYVTWSELKKKCAEMSKLIDEKFKELDDGEIKIIKTQIATLTTTINSVLEGQRQQDDRLSHLEETTANIEITVSEVKNMYDKGDIND